ncbi:hypothetical protein [Bacillus cereus]|uniref:hypothetical protein n=1 Tax=Bacillus cereus TaxID=1396 RepID=UPI0005E3187E|nr:hypothetical protein [Bacillus cereus]OKP50907.1 hypothetical protein A8A07_14695 [Bacillus cereus]CKG48985.1 Uncharacterised protein [Streptococcus pneumoniae]
MNEYEVLYLIKQNIEEKISKNKLFKLSIEEATLIVLEKVGVFFRLNHSAQFDKKQEYFKKIVRTNKTEINEVSFFQESIKWIFRWCTQYCSKESLIDNKEVVANDIYDLMGIAYSYDEFFTMWDLHRAKKVKYNKIGNKITFDYRNEDVYKTHVFYDTFFREINNEKQIKELNSLQINQENIIQIMNLVHQIDFDCSFNIEFEGFNLEDYKVFSTVLTQMFTQIMLNNIHRNIYILNQEKEGVLYLKKEEWIDKLSEESGLMQEKVENIIDFFTYDFSSDSSDISLSYFVPHCDNYISVSEAIFNLSRPAANAMRLLAKKKSSNYDYAQNNFETEEILKIKNNIPEKYLMTGELDKAKKNRPGMDLLIYDKEFNHLQIIELKYKIPIESTWDIKRLDEMLDKAYGQVDKAKMYTNTNLSMILNEYFGESYKRIIPDKIDYFILTNYSIGTGANTSLPTPILLIDHYVELMKYGNGMELVENTLNKNNKMLPVESKKRYSRFSLLGNKILVPEYSFKLPATL